MTRPQNFNVNQKALSALNDALVLDVWDDASVVLHLKNTGSAPTTAGVLAFEASINSTNGSDGDWFPVNATQTAGNTIATSRAASALAAGAVEAFAWKISVSAFRWFRVRVSTAFTANSIAQVTALASNAEVEFAPSVQSHGISGSVATTLPTPTPTNVVGAASNNATLVSNSGTTLMAINGFNPTASKVFVKLYNKATAPVPATGTGSDAPVMVIPVEAGAAFPPVVLGALGHRFATGLGYAIVGGAANNDNTPVAAGVILNISRI